MLHTILNPLFIKSTRFIIKEILRLANKTCLYFEVKIKIIFNYYKIYQTHKKTLLPDIFHELYLVRARKFPHFLDKKWDFEHESEFVININKFIFNFKYLKF